MPMTTYFGNLVIDHMLRGQPHTPPANMYASIYKGDPEAGGVEVTGTGYARKVIGFAAGSNKTTTNAADLDFGAAGSDWCPAGSEATYVGIHDALSAGNLYSKAALPAAKVIQNGDPVKILAGALDFNFT